MTTLAVRPIRDQAAPPGAGLAYQLLLLAAFTSSWTGVYLGPLKAVDVLLAVAVLAGAVAIITDFVAPPRWLTAGLGAAVLVLVLDRFFPAEPAYLASRFAFDSVGLQAPTESVTTAAIQWFITLGVLPIVFCNIVVKSGRPVEPLMYAFAWGSAVSCLIALTDFVGATAIGPTLIEFTTDQYGRQNGLASHVNNLGFAAVMAAPVALHLIRRGRWVIGATLLSLLITGTLLSGSRAAQLGVTIIVIGAVVLVRELRVLIGPMIYSLTLLAVIIILLPSSLADRTEQVLRFGADRGAQQSNAGRSTIAGQAIEDWEHSPIKGIGYYALTGAHSIYLQVLATGGILLFLGMAVYWIGILGSTRELAQRDVPFAAVVLAMVVAWLLCGIVENMLVERYLYFVVAAAWTLRVLDDRARDPDDDTASASTTVRRSRGR